MATSSLEERVAVLEAEVARLKRVQARGGEPSIPWWERRFGAFRDNPLYDEAMQLGVEYRRSQPKPGDEDVSS